MTEPTCEDGCVLLGRLDAQQATTRVFDLQRRVLDPEPVVQHAFDVAPTRMAVVFGPPNCAASAGKPVVTSHDRQRQRQMPLIGVAAVPVVVPVAQARLLPRPQPSDPRKEAPDP